MRLHGHTRTYLSAYRTDSLERWARRVRRWLAGGLAVHVYFDNTDAGAVNVTGWTEWGQYGQGIALQEFVDKAPGLNLGNLDTISIGFGTPGNTQPGGRGLVFFDDIRLYKPRCFAQLAKPALDFSNNCVVDTADLAILTNNWLISDYEVTPVDPGAGGLLASNVQARPNGSSSCSVLTPLRRLS